MRKMIYISIIDAGRAYSSSLLPHIQKADESGYLFSRFRRLLAMQAAAMGYNAYTAHILR